MPKDDIRYTIRMPRSLYVRCQQAAAYSDMSLNEWFLRAIEERARLHERFAWLRDKRNGKT